MINFIRQTKIFLLKLAKMENFLPRWMLFVVDLTVSGIAFSLSYLVCYHLANLRMSGMPFVLKLGLFVCVMAFSFSFFHTYRQIVRYTTFKDIIKVFIAVISAHICLFGINLLMKHFFGSMVIPTTGLILCAALTFSLIIVKKVMIMTLYDFIVGRRTKMNTNKKVPLLIYDVSDTLVEMARVISVDPESAYQVVGFVSPTANAAKKELFGLPVFFENNRLEALIEKRKIKALLINATELDREVKQSISEICIRKKIEIFSLPPLKDWNNQKPKQKDIQKIRIEDLLGRVPIEIDVKGIGEALNGKTIMVTGAAGSIGSEIVRQIARFEPGLLLLCDSGETPMHNLRLELEERFPNLNFRPFVIDVRNSRSMAHVFKQYHPSHVYHAAAYKHVPLMEECPNEAVLTNVRGTKNMVDLSIKYKVESFVMVSTDKAVNPTNVMGCSKRIAEIYVQSKAFNPEIAAHTRFITTRFGNVLGSNGSVIPRFREQIEKGGPVTVTHPDIIRYFMTIREACRLVLEAGNMGKGGEIFVFDMGEPVRIADMAAKMIRLAGFVPDTDIEIAYTGLRPGEKLYEELLNDEETTLPTHNRKIRIGKVREYDNYEEIEAWINDLLQSAIAYDSFATVALMKKIVPEFKSQNSRFQELDVVEVEVEK